jgi:hypothetical protein
MRGDPAGSSFEQLLVLLADHGAARPAGGDDVRVRLEDLDEPRGQVAGSVVEAVVEERLAAAGLGRGKWTRQPKCSRIFVTATPTWGRNWSVRQVTNKATSWASDGSLVG